MRAPVGGGPAQADNQGRGAGQRPRAHRLRCLPGRRRCNEQPEVPHLLGAAVALKTTSKGEMLRGYGLSKESLRCVSAPGVRAFPRHLPQALGQRL